MSKQNHNIYFNTRDELTKVRLDDVMYVASDGNYITVKFKSGRNLTMLAGLQNFIQAAEEIHDLRFIRVGRSHVINIAYVSQLNSLRRTISLVNDEMGMAIELIVSKEAIRQLKQIINDLPRKNIPNFQTTNGNMEAFQIIES